MNKRNKSAMRGTDATAETADAPPAQRARCATDDGSNGPVEAAVDAHPITKRDLEATFKKMGFSNRRSKAGAAVAWTALRGEEEPQPDKEESAIEFLNVLRGME